MKLTARQEIFLQKLLTLYRHVAAPVHYTTVAHQLDVSRYTAYDMLRVLEKKGLVASRYRAKAKRSGPGRSEVVFLPTPEAERLFCQADVGQEARVTLPLAQAGLSEAELHWANGVVEMALAGGGREVRYCAELLFLLLRLCGENGRFRVCAWLGHIKPESAEMKRAQLLLLGGFLLGLCVEGSQEIHEEWVAQILAYQAIVLGLSHEQCVTLADIVAVLFTQLATSSDKKTAD